MSGAGLPRRAAARVPIVVHEANARPGLANRLGARLTPYVATAVPGTPLRARPARRHPAAAQHRHARPGRHPRRGARAPSGWTPTGRRCWSSAARRVPGGSTTRPPAPPRHLRAAGVQVLHATGPAHDASTVGRGPAPPYVVLPYLDRMDLGLRRRRPRAVPSGRDDLRRADRGRPAGGLRPAADRQRRAASSTPCRSSRPAAACSSTTPTAPPDWVASTLTPLLHRRRPAGRDGSGGRRAAAGRTPTSGWPTWCSRRPHRRRSAEDGGEHGRRPVAELPVPAEELGRVHFIGIGGAGMSGIARIMLARGHRRSRQRRQGLARRWPRCARSGATVHVGHDAAHVGERRHRRRLDRDPGRPTPSWSRPARRGLRVLHRAEALAAVMAGRRGVAVAGTHGKTTTTSMLTVALQHCGADPSFAIGGDLNESGANAHDGTGDVFVAEADESDGSFLLLLARRRGRDQRRARPPRPLRHRRGGRRRRSTRSSRRIEPGGFLVVCADDPGAARLAASARAAGRRRPHLRRGRRAPTCGWSTW